MNFEHIDYFSEVKPYRGWSLRRQDIPRLSHILHPSMSRTLVPFIAFVSDLMNRLQYKTYRIEGIEGLPPPKSRGIIFASNHLSYLDPPLAGTVITKYFGKSPWFLAKDKLWQRLNYRISFSLLGALPFIRRSSDMQKKLENLKPFVSLLRGKESLMIFPEGTIPGELERGNGSYVKLRSDVEPHTGLLKGGPLIPFLAAVSDALVIPMGISGTGRALPPEAHPGTIWKKPDKKEHIVRVRFGKPIEVKEEINKFKPETNDPFREYTQKRILPAISELIDPELMVIPLKPPLKEEDYDRIKELESKIAQEYLGKGDEKLASLACHTHSKM